MWIGRGSPRSTQAASPGLHTQSQGVAAGDSTPLAPFPFSFFPGFFVSPWTARSDRLARMQSPVPPIGTGLGVGSALEAFLLAQGSR